MVDFESTMWKALAHVFPDLPVKGCVFHLTQAVWRKIQEVGLTTEYTDWSASCCGDLIGFSCTL